jgi:hypothetical protein
MVEGAGPLQVGDLYRAEACIASVTNTDAGKVVKVEDYVYRGDKPVIEVVSSFLYRTSCSSCSNHFLVCGGVGLIHSWPTCNMTHHRPLPHGVSSLQEDNGLALSSNAWAVHYDQLL